MPTYFSSRSLFSLVALSCLMGVALAMPELNPEVKPVHLVAPNPAGLLGWWLGDGETLDSLDRNRARLYGAARYGAGMVGQAFQLDGNGSYVKVPTSDLNPGTGKGMTLEMWIHPDTLAQKQPLAGWSAASKSGVGLWLEPASAGGVTHARLGADLRDSKGASHRLLSEVPVIAANMWQHVALTYVRESGRVVLYVDGKPVSERSIGTLELQTSLDFFLGKNASASAGKVTFKGSLDEVGVFSRAISPDEVQAIYEAASAGKQLVSDTDNFIAPEERWRLTQKRLTSFAAKHAGRSMNFATYIDGSDYIHIQGDKVWYQHRDWELPGKHGGLNLPTRVNGAEWFPAWNGNDSDKCTLASALPRNDDLVLSIDGLKLGGDQLQTGSVASTTIVQKPAATNDYEAILLLNDDNDGGPHWFIFSVAWDEKNGKKAE